MQFPPLRIFALAMAVALGFSGCVSPRLRKMLVIGVSRQPIIRRAFEDEFVAKLKAAGVDAAPSYHSIPEDGQVDEARMRKAVKKANADADMARNQVVWSGTVQTTRPGDIIKEIKHYVDTRINALKTKNLLSSG
jgi:hypothetical protein